LFWVLQSLNLSITITTSSVSVIEI
jgi:hypothetical protein